MTNKKTTKHQLLASVVSLMLCAAMLVGTTFAWFTDSVSSTNNIIKSGNLDVDMQYLAANGEWTAVEDDTALINNDAKWEPGHAEVVYLKASNLGELALKYQLGVNILYEKEGINVKDQTFKLSNYIYMGLADLEADADGKITPFANRAAAIDAVSAEATLIAANSGKGGELYPEGTEGKNSEAYFALVIYMPETVRNEANYKTNDAISDNAPKIELGVNIAAIQLAYEGDDFTVEDENDTYYDNDLNPAVTYVTTAQELYDALAAGKDVVLMGDIDMTGVSFSRSSNLTWKAIPSYSGILDGNGYKITGIKSNTGLFNEINGGTVKNLTIEATITSDVSAPAASSVGILANTVKGNVTIDSVVVSGTVESDATSVGGLIGAIEKSDNNAEAVVTIVNCTNKAAITSGSANDLQNVGALVGSVNANVSVNNSANEGTIDDEQNDKVLGEVSKEIVPEYTIYVADEESLRAAIKAGKNVILGADITVNANNVINVDKGADICIDLNGKKLSGSSDKSGNADMFLIKGNLSIINGFVEMRTTNNQGWNAMTAIFDITAGGALSLDNVNASNLGGTDMAIVAHLNNWGEVTLNVDNSTISSTYCAVRVFNSGYDMNNVTITNSELTARLALWVQYYTNDDFGNDAEKAAAAAARLNINVLVENPVANPEANDASNLNAEANNDLEGSVLYGFDNTVYYYNYTTTD